MGETGLERSVRVLQDCVETLSSDQARLKEANAFLEQRLQALEVQISDPRSPLQPPLKASEAPVPPPLDKPPLQTRGGPAVRGATSQGEERGQGEAKVAIQSPSPPAHAGDDAAADDEEAQMLEFTLGETLWDAPAFIGLPEIGGPFSSFVLMVSAFLNAVVQSYICYVLVYSNAFISKAAWKDMAEAGRRWRDNEAHEAARVDAAGVSLVSRVCGQDDSLSVAGGQSAVLSEINAYLNLGPFQLQQDSFGTGPLLASVCILLFAVLVLKEWRTTAVSLRAVFALPRGPTRVEDGRFVAMSRCRVTCFLLMGVIRAAVSAMLAYTGVMWLSYTSSITDLILNAAALGFVMDLDELLLETTVPSVVTKFASELEPLKYRRPPMYLEAVVPMVLLAAGVTTSVVALVLPNVQDMLNVKEIMCGGELKFAVTQNPAGFVVAKQTANFDPLFGSEDTIKITAVQELKNLDLSGPISGLRVRYSQPSLTLANWMRDSGLTVEEMSRANYCQDLDTFNGGIALVDLPVWFMTVREVTGLHKGRTMQEVPWSCADYARFCDQSGLLRNICPITCGCADPRSGLLFSEPRNGCPVTCRQAFAQALQNASCTDSPSVAGSPAWTRYWTTYKQMAYQLFPQVAGRYEDFVARKIALGCNDTAGDPSTGHGFCSEAWPIMNMNGAGTIRGFCPHSCCSGPDRSPSGPGRSPLCPMSCSAG